MPGNRQKKDLKSPAKWISIALGTTIALFLSWKFFFIFYRGPFTSPYVSFISGIAIAAFLLFGSGIWPVVFIGTFLCVQFPFDSRTLSFTLFDSPSVAFVFSSALLVQLLVFRYLFRRIITPPLRLNSLEQLVQTILMAGSIGCLVFPSLSVLGISIIKNGFSTIDITSWLLWWLAEAVGTALFIPLVFALTGKHKTLRFRNRYTIVLPVVFLFSVTLVIFLVVFANEQSRNELKFRQRSTALSIGIKNRFLSYQAILHSLERFYSASKQVNLKEFETFVSHYLSSKAGLRSLEWVPKVLHEQRSAHEKEAYGEGISDYSIRELDGSGKLVIAKEKSVYYPALYVQPFQEYDKDLGYDLGSDENLLTALNKAMYSARPIISPEDRQLKKSNENFSFLMFYPVYKKELIENSLIERRTNLLGFVLGAFHIKDIFNDLLSNVDQNEFHVLLADITPPLEHRVLFSNLPKSMQERIPSILDVNKANATETHWKDSFDFGGRNWKIYIHRSKEYIDSESHHFSWSILIGGILFSTLLGTLLSTLIGRAATTKQEVRQRTKELTKASQDLENEISIRIQAETEAVENAQKTRAIVDNIADAIITINAEGVIESFNPSAEKMFGYRTGEVLGKNVSILVPEPHHSKHDGYIATYLRTGKENIIGIGREVKGQRKDGTLVDIELSITKATSAGQMVFIGMIRDITDKKTAEEHLSKFKMAVEDSAHGIIITNTLGVIDYINPSFTELTGFTREDIIGKTPRILKSGIMEKSYYKRLWETLLSGQPWEEEIINRKKNGDLYTALQTVSPITDEENNIKAFVAVQKDVTEIKRARDELQLAKEEAEAANNAKSEFLANMSHEIRTPMNAVLGFSDLLYSIIKDPQQRRYLESIKTAGNGLLTLINDILDLSKIEAGKLELKIESVNIPQLMREISHLFEARIKEKSIDFKLEIDPSFPEHTMFDEIRLRQVLLNLVGNAVKFTESGFVKLTLSTRNIQPDEAVDFEIAIEDSGIGIPDDQFETIFESFRQQDGQSSRKYEGTGLGLAICKRLVEMLGGKLSLESILGKGSRFQINFKSIPYSSGEMNQQFTVRYIDISDFNFGDSKILIIDEVSHNRDLLKESLNRAGAEVLEAVEGKKGLKLAREIMPDLVLVDIRTPGIDGYEIARHLKASDATREIPVVAMTTSGSFESESSKIKKSFDGSISKPITMNQLFQELSKFLTNKFKREVPSSKKPVENQMRIEEVSEAPKLIAELKAKIMSQIESSRGVIEMSTIHQLADTLIDLAKTHQSEYLAVCGETLQENADSFDITGIQKTFKELEMAFFQLESAIENSSI